MSGVATMHDVEAIEARLLLEATASRDDARQVLGRFALPFSIA